MDKTKNFQEFNVRLLKPIEVAEVLNISLGFTYRLMRKGKIRTVAMEGARRVRPEDLQKYIENCLTPPTQENIFD